ncbi:hypothetical protein [Adhaeribacter pallidiroseus]|uniref:Uncharacterized protein n=1 Tax=Adhaeribacter pallidiroseus TaxID=2072847 RepID=A0A369QEQ6_9BACT|nr:hypothetical protein [Adhaeribacter pallidiroseus]RDC62790.1 hypothetical protein AHMF7616_01384 [Adhaeribacter pallidiroseus]
MNQYLLGFRINENDIIIEPNKPDKKRIKISTYFSRTNELVEWLASQYPNLDSLNAAQEELEIVFDQSLGKTPKQREERFSKARGTAKIINWIGGIVGIWTWFWTNPYEFAIIASIAVPIIAIIALKLSKGLIKIDERNNSAYPTICYGFIIPSLGLFMRTLLDFNIFNYDKVWISTSAITIIIMVVLLVSNKEFKIKRVNDWIAVISLSLITFAYGFGVIIILNCLYDKSEPELFNPKVLEKRISAGSSTDYYLQLTAWGQQKEEEEVSVSKEFYNQVNKNDVVKLYFKKGLLEIPWFTLGR